ncbi:hypothetical protein PPO43_00520 [Saprospira sp. CCB-QB6]|uniref:RHS repeat domain-containing protein n=1 Tax=Saprospira sp. CCB-QB6 TaxID=3023936 RepID=UPI00234A4F4B|nr:RHS repeat-associated core domain-containing protein [Saprospira sp. CCB-QB6]WCL81580.1 hypothetical protein PPO43_00520 [Saprospira sp. CCB-QB6]
MVRDSSEQIEEIVWNVQGKVQEVRFEAGKPGPSILQYEYDPMGNRLAKKKLYVDGPVDIRSEGQYYVRDPQGNVLAVYQYNEENIALVDDKDSLYLEELHLYGSARLGILKKALALRYRDESGAVGLPAGSLLKTTLAQSSYQQLELGRRRYELSNHLGNVLATVSDKSLGQDSSQTGQADYYLAQVSSASLYYPFGWEMPGRKFVSGEEYRFGFNGKEDDRDWGTQNIQDYGFRLYNPSIGKFLSVDPLAPDYPWYTPYQFAGNRPIECIDLDGLEPVTNPTSWSFVEAYEHGTMMQTPNGDYVFSTWSESYDMVVHYYYSDEKKWEPFTPEERPAYLTLKYKPARNRDGEAVVKDTWSAVEHYYFGEGEPVSMDKKALRNAPDLKHGQNRIMKGKTGGPESGVIGVNMTPHVYHIGKTTVGYKTTCNSEECTTVYTSEKDGFWDIFWGGDHAGPSGEFPLGTPYPYLPYTWSETYPNPGYEFDEDGVPKAMPEKVVPKEEDPAPNGGGDALFYFY